MKKKIFTEEISSVYDSNILVDIDGTIIPPEVEEYEISQETFSWVNELKLHRNTIFLCSNNNVHERNEEIARILGVTYLRIEIKKPLREAAGGVDKKNTEVVVIGDKFLTDGLFAKNLGAKFIKIPRLVSDETPLQHKLDCWLDDVVSSIFYRPTLAKKETISRISFEQQDQYGLVHKRWMLGVLEDSFKAGRRTIEMDLRMDSEHKFWISHATGVSASFFPPFIHKMTSEEIRKNGKRESLEHVLEIFSQYKNEGYHLILEIKSLGNDSESFSDRARELQRTLANAGAENAVAVASLSPGILLAIHDVMPEMPLILNGGIQPFISYQNKDISLGDKKWKAFGIPHIGETIISDGFIPKRADGEGTHTSYAFTHLPEELVKVMKEQRDAKIKFGGYVSLSAVTILTSIMDIVGMSKQASDMRKRYAKIITDLGLGIQVTTWGQSLSKIFKHLDPQTQVEMFKRELGPDTIIYTKNSEEWAYKLDLKD
jgi:predicted HAD superfamily phosphohydrolase YqeG